VNMFDITLRINNQIKNAMRKRNEELIRLQKFTRSASDLLPIARKRKQVAKVELLDKLKKSES